MGLFSSDKCKECGIQEKVKRCPYCKVNICSACLKYLVLKDETPDFFVGKEVTSYQEYRELHLTYQKTFKSRGAKLHVCEDYSKQVWRGIIKQVKDFEKVSAQKAIKITIKK